MKTPLVYGAGIAVALSALTLVAHLLGWSTDPEKLLIGMVVGLVGFCVIQVTGLVMGTRRVRAELGAAGMTYGSAFGTGVKITVLAALIGVLFNYLFYTVIQPDFAEIQVEAARHFMERMNMPASQIELALEDARAKATLGRQLTSGFIFGLVFGTIVSLITAAILKRPPAEDLALSAPPSLG